jgi:hypothetical protein
MSRSITQRDVIRAALWNAGFDDKEIIAPTADGPVVVALGPLVVGTLQRDPADSEHREDGYRLSVVQSTATKQMISRWSGLPLYDAVAVVRVVRQQHAGGIQ